ncbi:hypothetical protein THAOC_19223 [Thalassiosira oceanica]|uniref:Glycosyltransferase family 92 protein n=1 Tax=Thalassiosira oceanica TaxID=159749 RepID=K0SHD9_THAOC|nr:hypothetical protein THAOC_19223 [Thalassiosira oceanica]|eukprot:EJK60431.1 hypothetical protein THAOC_19223 [Thalassiosira oceanica]
MPCGIRRETIRPPSPRQPSPPWLRRTVLRKVTIVVLVSCSLALLAISVAISNNAIQLASVLEGDHQVHASLRRPDEGVRDGIIQNHDVMQMPGPDAAPSHPRDERAQTPKQGDISAKSRPTSGKDSGKILNSEIYQPDTTTGRRLSNQLFQFVGALQHAKVLKRTLVVPDEKSDFECTHTDEFYSSWKDWNVRMYFDIWDLSSLNENYDIDWNSGLDGSFADEKMLASGCLLSTADARALLRKGPKSWIELDKRCPDVVHLNDKLFTCKRQHQYCGDKEAQMEAYSIYSHLKLSPSLLQYIPSKRPQFTGLGYDEMAIHSRRAGEGMYKWEICIEGTKKTCLSHMKAGSRNGNKFCDERTIKGNCAIWADLNYQIKSQRFFKPNLKDYKFVLASDGTHDWDLDFKGQYIAANNSEWLREFCASGYIKKERIVWGTVDALSATLLDLFSLVDSKYLLGAYYSTLSLNACYLRGLDRIYDSNMCWMLIHPGHPEPVIPPADDSVNIYDNNEEKSGIPPALVNDVEHAFVRSSDGEFIAIDRYLIHGNTKNTVAVLGDGLVPLSFVKDDNGKESVYTNVTCSSSGGKQRDTPATIILMGGHRSFSEHYYIETMSDTFRTMLILCEQLHYDAKLARQPPLTLRSHDGEFSITIGSPLGRGLRPFKRDRLTRLKLVHCLGPISGLQNARWLIEYLEYYKSAATEHVHVYNLGGHSEEVDEVLKLYRSKDFITRHDWSGKASNGFTTTTQLDWASQTDCTLRVRGFYDYALFADIDEIVAVPGPSGNLIDAVKRCHTAHTTQGKAGCSFNSQVVSSVYTKLHADEEKKMTDKLLLERYNGVEASPLCPYNCKCAEDVCSDRRFHYGRTLPVRPLWTHAISRDYSEMEQIMEVLPDDVIHVRKYQGEWYKSGNLLNTMEEKASPLPEEVLKKVRQMQWLPDAKTLYNRLKTDRNTVGVDWIVPVERDEKYHRGF